MENTENQWKGIFKFGGITAIIALIGILLDIIFGIITGGNLSALPQTAVDRFIQFQDNNFLGLYNLDFLNIINQMILIPTYLALYGILKSTNRPYALLGFVVFLFGSAIMVANNTALSMYELSDKYFESTLESQKLLYAAAGESMLATGAHGSPGIFLGFFIPNIANLIFSILMLRGKIFTKLNSWLGISGSILMLVYVIIVNFVSGGETMATAIAMPGGLLLMAWIIIFTFKLFKISKL